MNSQEAIGIIWRELQASKGGNLHAGISQAVEAVLRESIMRRSSDNVTMLLVAFQAGGEEELRVQTSGSVERITETTSSKGNRMK